MYKTIYSEWWLNAFLTMIQLILGEQVFSYTIWLIIKYITLLFILSVCLFASDICVSEYRFSLKDLKIILYSYVVISALLLIL